MRTYHNPAGTKAIVVTTDTNQIPLRPIFYWPSPAGMTWGDADSNGPHDTALSILADWYEHVAGASHKVAEAKAGWLHHQFCNEFVGHFKDGWSIDSDTIAAWVAKHPETIEAAR
jgi:hypothetical protein